MADGWTVKSIGDREGRLWSRRLEAASESATKRETESNAQGRLEKKTRTEDWLCRLKVQHGPPRFREQSLSEGDDGKISVLVLLITVINSTAWPIFSCLCYLADQFSRNPQPCGRIVTMLLRKPTSPRLEM